MCNMSKTSDEIDGSKQRILTVNALVALCYRRGGRPGRRRAVDDDKENEEPKTEVSSPDDMDLDKRPIEDPFPMHLNPRQYPVCIGDKGLSQQQRTRCYHNIWNMRDHAEKHFEGLPSDKPYICSHPKCGGKLLGNVTHFKNGCALEHNSRLRG